eukprot:COSAG02_NODE_409_length_22892_cov_11.461150_21_plen_89_part_00
MAVATRLSLIVSSFFLAAEGLDNGAARLPPLGCAPSLRISASINHRKIGAVFVVYGKHGCLGRVSGRVPLSLVLLVAWAAGRSGMRLG